jgi:hypothetical protein
LTPAEKKLMMSYEALDYDVPPSQLYRRERLNNKSDMRGQTMAKWVIFAVIGTTCGLLAWVLAKATR